MAQIKRTLLPKAFFGDVTPEVPASILQMHPDVTIVGDTEALAKIPRLGNQAGKFLDRKEGIDMKIKNVQVFGEDKCFTPGEIYIKDGLFSASDSGDEVLDGEGCFAIPGLVDIHFHGCVGDDFCDATQDAIRHMAEHEGKIGVTSICRQR